MRVMVLSANMGSSQFNHMVKQEGVEADFNCYNDTNFPMRTSSFTPRMRGKIPKMLGWILHPGYDYYIWMDMTLSMSRPDAVTWYLNQLSGSDAVFFKHPQRDTVLDEARTMVAWSKNSEEMRSRINGEPVVQQAERYRMDPSYSDDMLIEASSFCYSSKLVENMDFNIMKEWYFQVCFQSIRDQISLPYCLKKFNVKYNLIYRDVREEPHLH
jgi:hypothetical protein